MAVFFIIQKLNIFQLFLLSSFLPNPRLRFVSSNLTSQIISNLKSHNPNLTSDILYISNLTFPSHIPLSISHMSYFLFYISYLIFYILYIISHISYFIYHISYFISYISYLIFHILYIISHSLSLISHISYLLYHISYFISHNSIRGVFDQACEYSVITLFIGEIP